MQSIQGMQQQQSAMKRLAAPETTFTAECLSGEKLNFRIIHWSPTKTFSRISKIGKYFAVPVSMMVDSKPGDPSFSEALPAALLQLFNTMDEDDILQFIALLLDEVYYDGISVLENFDRLFMGKNEVIIQLMAKVVEINYSPFFKTGFGKLISSIIPVVGLSKAE